MLIELAIGDAYGCAFECADDDFVQENNHLEYINHNKHPSLVPQGHYTDDTQMTIAIAEAIVEGVEWTPLNIANKFVDCFHRDQRRGYNGGFFMFLKKTKTGQAFLDNIRPDSEKSGAAMRASPLGLIADINEIRQKCEIQAKLTHDTHNGISSALCAALMVHYFCYRKGPKEKLIEWLNTVEGWNIQPWNGQRVRSNGWQCGRAAITAIQESNTLSDVLYKSIAVTGDVDTVATIAVAAAVWSDEIENDLPQSLYDGLENGKFGHDYLMELDNKLRQKLGV
jgi:ADP-ribosylglycohydrolase